VSVEMLAIVRRLVIVLCEETIEHRHYGASLLRWGMPAVHRDQMLSTWGNATAASIAHSQISKVLVNITA
jgi:hypothetical protein